jgi:hypothetical protein
VASCRDGIRNVTQWWDKPAPANSEDNDYSLGLNSHDRYTFAHENVNLARVQKFPVDR